MLKSKIFRELTISHKMLKSGIFGELSRKMLKSEIFRELTKSENIEK